MPSDVGDLEKSLTGPRIPVKGIYDDLPGHLKKEVADSCALLLAFLVPQDRIVKAISAQLEEARRGVRLRLEQENADLALTQRYRGQIDGLKLAEKVLTDPGILGETRRQMLGTETENPQGMVD